MTSSTGKRGQVRPLGPARARPLGCASRPTRLACVWRCLAVAGGLLLAACSSTPDLTTQVRAGFDVSGTWVLDPARSDATPDTRRVVDDMDRQMLRRNGGYRAHRNLVDSAVFAFVGQDFPVLKAERLLIEQQADSMGIRYEPGGYRDVSWGERKRGLWTLFAGWNDAGAFVIHSDSDDIRAVETHVLLPDGALEVLLRVRAEGGDLDIVRTFVRPR